EPDLAEEPGEAVARALAQPHCLVAPAPHQLLDQRARLLVAEPAAGGDLLGERVRALRGQGDGADAGEDQLLGELPGRASGLGHEGVRGAVGGGAPAWPLRSARAPAAARPRRRQAWEWARPRGPPRTPRARPRSPRGSRPAPAPCGGRIPARAPSPSSGSGARGRSTRRGPRGCPRAGGTRKPSEARPRRAAAGGGGGAGGEGAAEEGGERPQG